MAIPAVAKVTATVTSLNTVMREVNDAIMCFDANHRLTSVGYRLSASVRAPLLARFMYSS